MPRRLLEAHEKKTRGKVQLLPRHKLKIADFSYLENMKWARVLVILGLQGWLDAHFVHQRLRRGSDINKNLSSISLLGLIYKI